MIGVRRRLGRLWQAIVGAPLAFVVTLPLAAAGPAPQHGGGGFALLLLDYRQSLERLIAALRRGTAELAEGAAMARAEMMGTWHRVTAGSDPLLLLAALAAILGPGFLARHAVRRRLAGAPVPGSSRAADGFGPRLARACYGLLVDLLGLGAFDLVTLMLAALPRRPPVRSAASFSATSPRADGARRGARCALPAGAGRAACPIAAAGRARRAASLSLARGARDRRQRRLALGGAA